MKASFRVDSPNLLLEAGVGDLFVPLGPDLVECVCARRSAQAGLNGVSIEKAPFAARGNPNAALPIVVIACRVGPGEPEYFPPGYTRMLSGATPVVFLQQVEPLSLRSRDTPPTVFHSGLAELKAFLRADQPGSHDTLRPEPISKL